MKDLPLSSRTWYNTVGNFAGNNLEAAQSCLSKHGLNCQSLPDGKLNIAMKTVHFSAINTISYFTLFPICEILTSHER